MNSNLLTDEWSNIKRNDDDEDDGFTMLWQIKSAKKMPFNRSDFELPKDHKKVDKLD